VAADPPCYLPGFRQREDRIVSRVVVVGASQQARQTIDAIDQRGADTVVGLVDDATDVASELGGYPVLGRIDDLPALIGSHHLEAAIVTIGDNWTRGLVVERIAARCPTLAFATAVHPSAQIGARTIVGPGTVIMAGVVINNDGVIGEHAFFATSSSLDHDGRMGPFASLAPHVATGGSVEIGAFTAVGIGAAVVHGVTIGAHTVVGAGSTVLSDLPASVVAYGTPARVVRSRAEGERYL